MKILFGFLNFYANRVEFVKKNLQKLSDKRDDILILSDTSYDKFNTQKIDGKNVAQCKNIILKYAKDNSYDYCIIIEDDVKLLDKIIIQSYINMLEKYNLSFVMYGFHNQNRVLGFKPNPCMIIKASEFETLNFSRYVCGAFCLFKITDDMLFFDEHLTLLEMQEYTDRAVIQKKIPFNGFYFDTFESWKHFEKYQCESTRVKNKEIVEADIKIIGKQFTLENNADLLINLIREKNKPV